MKQKPSFQCYQQDFLGSIDFQTMTMEERGCYFTLFLNCYNNGGVLPKDKQELALLCNGTTIASKVFKKFYESENFLRHKRVDEEMRKIKKFSKIQSNNAKKRWNKDKNPTIPSHTNGNAMGSNRQCSSSSSSSFIKKTNKKEIPVELFKTLEKWLGGFEKVKNPKAYANKIFDTSHYKIIQKALKIGKPTSIENLSSQCEYYKKQL